MKTITFECEVVTPMFLAGADGKTPELRPPSIKGLMRFWWRAMNGHLSLENLKEKESDIFGGSGEGGGRSNIIIKILNNSMDTNEYRPLPHSENKKFPLSAIKPNEKFKLKIGLIENFLNNKNFDIEKLKNLFILISILGGLGRRVRRGFGSFRIFKINTNLYDIQYSLKNILSLINDISNNKYKVEDDKIVLKENLTVRYPFLKKIQIGKEYDLWEELLKKVGEASHNNDIKSLGFAIGGRLSSPIYVSVLKNADNKYFPVISSLNTVFKDYGKVDYEGQNKFTEAIL